MTVGPAIQSVLTPLACSPSSADAFPYFSVDMFSSAGLVDISLVYLKLKTSRFILKESQCVNKISLKFNLLVILVG